MARLNIGYDLLTWEGDILRLHFWTHAFEFLKRTGAVFLQTEGKLEGLLGDADRGRGSPVGCRDERGQRRRATPQDERSEDEQRPARESHRPIRRHRHLRRQGHGVPALEVRAARQGLPLPEFAATDGKALWSTTSDPAAANAGAAVRARVVGVQRHRHAPVLPAEAGEAGARGARVSRAGGALGSLLVRDGRAVALDRARARLRYGHRCRPSVRRGLRTQGAWREGRRSDRPADRQGQPGSRQAQSRPACRRDPPHRGDHRHRRGPLLHGEVLARQGHRLRHRRGAQLRGRERAVSAVCSRARQQHLQQAEGTRGPRRGALLPPRSVRRRPSR